MSKQKKTVQRTDDDVFVAIAHPVRRQILHQLVHGELPVMDLAEPFDMSRSAVGQHLEILLNAGLVTRHKRGRKQFYRLQPENLSEVRAWMNYFERHWPEKLNSLESFLDNLAEEETDDEEG